MSDDNRAAGPNAARANELMGKGRGYALELNDAGKNASMPVRLIGLSIFVSTMLQIVAKARNRTYDQEVEAFSKVLLSQRGHG